MGLPDYREEIKLLIDSGEYIVVELLIKGTYVGPMNGMEPTGRSVAFRDVTILKLLDGKIVEQRGLSVYLTMFQQLGVIPEFGSERCSLATAGQDGGDQTDPTVSSIFPA